MLREEIGHRLRTRYIGYIMLGAAAISMPFIFNSVYLRDLLVTAVIFSIMALGLNIIMGYMGQFSLGHQAFSGMAAYGTAMLTIRLGVNPWLGFVAGIALATVFGLLVGYVALRATRGVYLAIVTFGIGAILFVVAKQAYGFTKGQTGLFPIPHLSLGRLVFDTEISFYYLALVFLVFAVYFINRWLRSRFGRAVVAIRENEDLANSVGIHSFRNYVLAFTIATALAGLGGSLYAYYVGVVNPMLFSVDYMVMMLVMVILGGTGVVGGPILGSFIYVILLELLPFKRELTLVVFGAILLACITFMPEGVYPRVMKLHSRIVTLIKEKGLDTLWRGRDT